MDGLQNEVTMMKRSIEQLGTLELKLYYRKTDSTESDGDSPSAANTYIRLPNNIAGSGGGCGTDGSTFTVPNGMRKNREDDGDAR